MSICISLYVFQFTSQPFKANNAHLFTHFMFLPELFLFYLSQAGNSMKTIKLFTDTQDNNNNTCIPVWDIRMKNQSRMKSAICHQCTALIPSQHDPVSFLFSPMELCRHDHMVLRHWTTLRQLDCLYTHHTDSQCSIHRATINM